MLRSRGSFIFHAPGKSRSHLRYSLVEFPLIGQKAIHVIEHLQIYLLRSRRHYIFYDPGNCRIISRYRMVDSASIGHNIIHMAKQRQIYLLSCRSNYIFYLVQTESTAWSNRRRGAKQRFTWPTTRRITCFDRGELCSVRSWYFSVKRMLIAFHMTEHLQNRLFWSRCIYGCLLLVRVCYVFALSYGQIGVDEPNGDSHDHKPAELFDLEVMALLCSRQVSSTYAI